MLSSGVLRLLLSGAGLGHRLGLRAGGLLHRARRRLGLPPPTYERWSADAEKRRADFYETVWEQAAAACGGDAQLIGDGLMLLQLGSRRTVVFRNFTPLDDPAAQRLSLNKTVANKILQSHGIPIAQCLPFTMDTLHEAAVFLTQRGRPCVIKPADGTGGGQGVHTGVCTHLQLLVAAAAASRYARQLLIEEQIEGDTFRLLFLDGKILDAVRRSSPTVTGDGRHRIRELVRQANEERVRRGAGMSQTPLTCDREMIATLRAQGLGLGSIPEAGDVIQVKRVVNENRADENEPALHLLCDSVVDTAARTAYLLGLRAAGVDVITRDPTRPLAETGGVVLEANAGPGFHYHYHRRGASCPVAEHILRALWRDSTEKTWTGRMVHAERLKRKHHG